MIMSFADDVARDVFYGIWAFSSYPGFEGQVENFYWDMLLIDASGTLTDLKQAFRDRISVENVKNGDEIVVNPPASDEDTWRSISFVWQDGQKHGVRSWNTSQQQGRAYG